MNPLPFDPSIAVLVIPASAAAVLFMVPSYVLSARLNVLASLLTFGSTLLLFAERPLAGQLLMIDDLNVVFIVLNTLVGFTTSLVQRQLYRT